MGIRIGNIKIDDTYYPGEDYYCDGDVEDELLDIAKNYAPIEYPKLIEERAKWPILYHLSTQRQNIVEWIPMEPGAKVLEVGSGCGAITGMLSQKSGVLDCVDLSMKRSKINAYRNQDCDNVTIHVGNFKDIEPHLDTDYDYIFLIGVFEYGQSYMGSDAPYDDFLNMIQKHIHSHGRIIMAIENKFGLKYFAGCQEDHLGTYFSGIENYADGGGVRTFTRNGLEAIFKRNQISEWHFYYPYPDYKFMTAIFSDERLPQKGELMNNLRNFDRDRMLLFDEKNAFDGIIEDGEFSLFSNSYLVVLGQDFPVKYARYSNDRAKEFQIKTQMNVNEEGDFEVWKYPLTKEAEAHISDLGVAYDKLVEKYNGGNLAINKCEIVEQSNTLAAKFEFIRGKTLEEELDLCLEKDDIEGFHALFRKYLDILSYNQSNPTCNYDFVFSNIIIDENSWNLIDYEWTFEKEVPVKELAFRAIYCYLLENEKRNKLNLDYIFELLDISEAEAESYRKQEMEFQKYVTGKRKSMSELREMIGGRLIDPKQFMNFCAQKGDRMVFQVYEDLGSGFSEDTSYFIKDAYEAGDSIVADIEVSGNVRMLRLDPAMCSCSVKLEEIVWNQEALDLQKGRIVTTNGAKTREEKPTVVFGTMDPQILVDLSKLTILPRNTLHVEMKVIDLPFEFAISIQHGMQKGIFSKGRS